LTSSVEDLLYRYDTWLGAYFGHRLEVRSLEFFLWWGAATERRVIGPALKKAFQWFCRYYSGFVVPSQDSLLGQPKILPYEDVLTIVRRARVGRLQPCSCKSYNIPTDRNMPRDSCMGFEYVEAIEDIAQEGYHDDFQVKDALLRKLKQCEEYGLVHQIMTVSRPAGRKWYVLCNCDAESCIPMILHLKYDIPMVRGSGFVARIGDKDQCIYCGKCTERCIFGAALQVDDSAPLVKEDSCLGCGLCITTCPAGIRFMEKTAVDEVPTI
jgi:electron transport complex protein RnfB